MFKQSTFYIILICCSSSFGNTNILVIVSDDLRTALGCYGDKSAVTPNIDDLSKKCVIFNKAYAQVCTESKIDVELLSIIQKIKNSYFIVILCIEHSIYYRLETPMQNMNFSD